MDAPPMGFGAPRPAPKPSMLVGFLGAPAELAQAREAGAEVLIAAGGAGSDAAKLRTAAGDLPLGMQLSADADLAALKQAGVDFVVFDAETTPASVLLNEDVGHVLALPAAPEEAFLRSLEPLSLEAVYLAEAPSPFTVARQIEMTRTGMLTRKPIICGVTPSVSPEDLQCLRAAGVAVLLLDAVEGLSDLKAKVAGLPPRRQRREERPVVSLPRPTAPEEEDEDDRLGRDRS